MYVRRLLLRCFAPRTRRNLSAGLAEFIPLDSGARFFRQGLIGVFYKTKCAAKEGVALDPPDPFARNSKELPLICGLLIKTIFSARMLIVGYEEIKGPSQRH